MSSSIDFLSRSRDLEAAPARRWPAWLLPAAMLLSFAAFFFILFRDRLLPAVEVRVATVLATTGTDVPDNQATAAAAQEQATLLFQASGWVEPEPYAVKASSLIDGVVRELHVLEGQTVKKGTVLAELVNDDAKLKVAAAEARLRMLSAEKRSQESAVAAGVSKKDSVTAEIIAAETLESEAKDQMKRFEGLKDAVSQSDVIMARLRWQREQANLTSARAKLSEQLAEIKRLESAAATKEEEISLARVALEQEKLNLERTRIPAPITGRVLRLMATPGEKKMLAMDHPDSSTIAVLYDPAKLQVRVDVPLADAAQLQAGQKTRIHCSLLPDQTLEGEVTRITGEADLQRNTLQAKVRIQSPPDVLRPEMLCRVEFLGAAAKTEAGMLQASGALALWVPIEAVQGDAVWIFDGDTSHASKRVVKTSSDKRDDYVRIQEGLRPGEQVILSPANLREGQRVKPLKPITPTSHE